MISRLLLSTAAAATIIFSSVSCDTEGLNINKDFSGGTIEIAIPPSADPGTVSIVKEDIETNLRESLNDFDISEDRLKKVGVKSVVARIVDPSNAFSFDNLQNVVLVFQSEDLGNIEIASLPNATGTEANFVVSDSELKDFLLSDSFAAVLTGTSDSGIAQGVVAEIDVTYEITAGL